MSQHHARLSGRKRQERNAKILRHSDVCHICGHAGSDSVDHVIPLARGGADDVTNLAPAHHDVPPFCNRRKADRMPSDIDRHVVLVCGPPGAGKTTHAHTIATTQGLDVYDLDDPHWQGSDALFRAALIRIREDTNARAVVIRSGATISARQKAANTCGATHCLTIDTDLTTCIERIKQRGRTNPPIHIQTKAARDWWGNYEPGEIHLSFASLRLRRSGSLA